jgi:hypothetical protein
MCKTWGTVLGGLVLLLGCGGNQNFQYGRPNTRYSQRVRYILGPNYSPQQQEAMRRFEEGLVAEPWIALDSKFKPTPDTAVKLYPTRFDGSYNYQYNFDLLYKGGALRGKTQLTRGPNGELDGFVSGAGYIVPPSGCVELSTIAWFAPYAYADRCVHDRTGEYEGTKLVFESAQTEIGPLLHVTFRRPLGQVEGYKVSDLYFQRASKLPK